MKKIKKAKTKIRVKKEPKIKAKNGSKSKVMGKIKSKSIKAKLLFGMVGLSVGITILCGLTSGFILYQSSHHSMENEVSMAAKAYSQVVQNKIQQYKMGIEQIATNKTITDKSISQINISSMKDMLAANYGFKEIHVVDSTGKSDDGADESDRDFFKQAVIGKTCISSPLAQKTGNHENVVYVATKVNNLSGYDGIVYGTITSDAFSSMVDSATVGETGYSFIVDKTGTVIAHKDRTIVNSFTNYIEAAKKDSSLSSAKEVIQAMIAGKTDGGQFKLNGNQMDIAYRPISGTDGWSIGSAAKETEMMQDFYISVLITMMLVVFFIVISCVIAFRVASPIAKPIVSLVKRIEQLAEGDLQSEVPVVKSKDEIGVLAASFTSTVNTLKGYVGEISSVLGSLADGDCTVETHQEYKGDFVAIETALNTHISSLNEVFTNINQSADQVANGAGQVASSSQALSQGATEQASSIEELSASITEIASEVNQNASNAATANKLSLEASSEVARGNEHMRNMIDAMAEISSSSSQIGKIIKTIEDIAFQTNILALNAAVEAARAGAAGKGFAVVADEVRNLASKSAEAAKNTTVLIESSLKAVNNGTQIADKTAESLNIIIENAKKTTDLITEISTASNGQATSISQVTFGVDQISAVVQTNSATSEESAATSEELSAQAQALKDTLAFLKLKDVSSNHTQGFSAPAVQKDVVEHSAPSQNNLENSKY